MCKETVIVTGASGFLGQHFICNLSSVFNIISVSQKKLTQKNVENIQIDFSKTESFFELIAQKKPRCIFNFCASFENDRDESFEINVGFPQKLLDFLSQHKFKTRVVLVGSAAEYGFNQLNQPLKEDSSLFPISVYGCTKAMQSLLPSLYVTMGVDVVYARIFNLYGKNINENLLPGFLEKKINDLLRGKIKKIKLRPLTDIYDFIHVDEAIKLVKLLYEKGQSGNIYNVGSGAPVLVRDFVKQRLKERNLNFDEVVEESVDTEDKKTKIVFSCTKKINSLKEGRD